MEKNPDITNFRRDTLSPVHTVHVCNVQPWLASPDVSANGSNSY